MTDRSHRRAVFLAEMGVGPLWIHRSAAASLPDTAVDTVPGNVVVSAVTQSIAQVASTLPVASLPVPPLSSSPSSSAPVSAWDDSPQLFAQPNAATPLQTTAPTAPSDSEIATMDWLQLKNTVSGCIKCGLCQTRTKTVFGTGDQKAKWLFVGEGPGRNEDLQGEPFVGPAGKLLDNMLLAIGIRRGENAYIANIVKCRPIDANGRDRAPTAEEAAACMPYLERQIALIKPTIIIALGKTAALSLLKLPPSTPVSKLRGVVHRFADLPLVVTYHPAYLLRSLTEKRKSWEDLCLAMDTYASAP